MKLANSIYVLCEDQKEIDKLERICKVHGAYSVFIHNPPKGKMLFEVIAFSEKDLKLIKKGIEA